MHMSCVYLFHQNRRVLILAVASAVDEEDDGCCWESSSLVVSAVLLRCASVIRSSHSCGFIASHHPASTANKGVHRGLTVSTSARDRSEHATRPSRGTLVLVMDKILPAW